MKVLVPKSYVFSRVFSYVLFFKMRALVYYEKILTICQSVPGEGSMQRGTNFLRSWICGSLKASQLKTVFIIVVLIFIFSKEFTRSMN